MSVVTPVGVSIDSAAPAAAPPPAGADAATSASAALAVNGPGVTFSSLVSFRIPESREGLLAMARMAELCERWDELLVCVKRLAKMSVLEDEFSSDERQLLHVAYRTVVLSRRASWRVAKSAEQTAELNFRVEPTPQRQSALRVAQEFRVQLENEITDVCTDAVVLIEHVMFPAAVGDEARLFLYKLVGDFYRYLAEVNPSGTFAASVALYQAKPAVAPSAAPAPGASNTNRVGGLTPTTASLLSTAAGGSATVAKSAGGMGGFNLGLGLTSSASVTQHDEYWVLAQEAYARATEFASALRPSHPMRLSVALNLAIFFYETMRSTDKALHHARQAFTAAIADDTPPETILESEMNEAGAVLQLLQENLFFWTQPSQ